MKTAREARAIDSGRSTASPPPIARLIGITKRLEGRAVLEGIQLEVHRGEIVSLLAPNGSGKTVLVYLLLGLRTPDAGTVELLGNVCAPPYPRAILRRIGVVLENPGFYGRLTMLQNMSFFASVYEVDDATSRITQMLEEAGLWHRRHDRVESLSHGLRQHLAIVRALLHQPELVVLDEPTAGLDGEAIRATLGLVVDLVRRSGSSAILTSPRLDEVEDVADRAIVLDAGRVIADASMKEVAALARDSAADQSSAAGPVYRRLLTRA